MTYFVRTNGLDPDFILLVKELNAYLHEVDGEDFDFYFQFNQLDNIKHVVLGYVNELPVACGSIKQFDVDTMEVKRMFTKPEMRGNRVASKILIELENWAKELGYKRCILETGLRQTAAISLYKNSAYIQIPNYGQYKGVENSVCFEKYLTA